VTALALALMLLDRWTANQTAGPSEAGLRICCDRTERVLGPASAGVSPPCEGGVRGGGPGVINYKSAGVGVKARPFGARATELTPEALKIAAGEDPITTYSPFGRPAIGSVLSTPPNPPFTRGGDLGAVVAQHDPAAADPPDPVKTALRTGSYPWYDPATDRIKPIWTPKQPWQKWIGKKLENLAEAVRKFLSRFHLRGIPGLSGLGELPMTAVLLAALIAFVIVLVRLWIRRDFLAPDKPGAGHSIGRAARLSDLPEGVRPASGDPWSEALRRRSAGDLGGSVVCLFAYQLLTLDQLGLIRLVPGHTGRQYVQRIREPHLVDSLESTLTLFEDVYYGRKLPTVEAFEAVWKRALDFRERRGLAGASR
jgi:hypothetical protein